MAIATTPTTLINNVTVAASGNQDQATALDVGAGLRLDIGYTMTFNASAAAGARIELYGDPTGANASFSIGTYDNPIDSFEIPVSAGHTVNSVIRLEKAGKYVKARIVNLSSSYSITGASLYGLLQTA